MDPLSSDARPTLPSPSCPSLPARPCPLGVGPGGARPGQQCGEKGPQAGAWPGRGQGVARAGGSEPGEPGGSMSLGTAFRRAGAKASRRSDSAQLLHPSQSSHVRGRDHRPQRRWHLTVSEPADGPAVPFLVGPLRIS